MHKGYAKKHMGICSIFLVDKCLPLSYNSFKFKGR